MSVLALQGSDAMRDNPADSSRLPWNDRRFALPRHLRFVDFVNELVTIGDSNTFRREFLFLTIERLDLRIF